jgi:hypothetical protein
MGLSDPHAEFHERRDKLLKTLAGWSLAAFPATLAGDLARITDSRLAFEWKHKTAAAMDRVEKFMKEFP